MIIYDMEFLERPAQDLPEPIDVELVDAVFLELLENTKDIGWAGLHAKQIGLDWNIFLSKINYDSPVFRCYINCHYTTFSKQQSMTIEGCLSHPDTKWSVLRYRDVILNGFLYEYTRKIILPVKKLVGGIEGYIIQHESDHGVGRCIWNVGKKYKN